jgi:hypothetical protein
MLAGVAERGFGNSAYPPRSRNAVEASNGVHRVGADASSARPSDARFRPFAQQEAHSVIVGLIITTNTIFDAIAERKAWCCRWLAEHPASVRRSCQPHGSRLIATFPHRENHFHLQSAIPGKSQKSEKAARLSPLKIPPRPVHQIRTQACERAALD